MQFSSPQRDFDFCNHLNKKKMEMREGEAGRAAAVQLRHAGHTPAGSRRRRLPIDKYAVTNESESTPRAIQGLGEGRNLVNFLLSHPLLAPSRHTHSELQRFFGKTEASGWRSHHAAQSHRVQTKEDPGGAQGSFIQTSSEQRSRAQFVVFLHDLWVAAE